jgi:hypothetical protein
MAPTVVALTSTVALLVVMGFFMFGSLPLLILKHDTPLDSKFIRGLFNVYYVAVMPAAAVGAIGYGLAGQPAFSLGMGCLVALAYGGRRWVVSRMDALRQQITDGDPAAISPFRRLHVGGMLLNAAQLGTLVWGMTRLAV